MIKVCGTCGTSRLEDEMGKINEVYYCGRTCYVVERGKLIDVNELIELASRGPFAHKQMQRVDLPKSNKRWFK